MNKFFCLVFISLILVGCSSKKERPLYTGENPEPWKVDTICFRMCKQFIEPKLNYPLETEYRDDFKLLYTTNDSLSCIEGTLVTKNGYGIKSGVYYSVQLKYLGGDWRQKNNWSTEKVYVTDEEGRKRVYQEIERRRKEKSN